MLEEKGRDGAAAATAALCCALLPVKDMM